MTRVTAPALFPGEECDRARLCRGYEIHARIYFPLIDISTGSDIGWADLLGIPRRELTGDLSFGTLAELGCSIDDLRVDNGMPGWQWRRAFESALLRLLGDSERPTSLIAGFWTDDDMQLPDKSLAIDRPDGLEATYAEDSRLSFFRLAPTFLTDPERQDERQGPFPTIMWADDHSFVFARKPTDYSVFLSGSERAYDALVKAGLDMAKVDDDDLELLYRRKIADIHHGLG